MRECVTGILGRKLGSTQVFDPETGACSHVTVIKAGPCRVTQVKTREEDGYSAIQLGFEEVTPQKLRRVTKARQGHFKSAGVPAMRVVREVRLAADAEAAPGDTVTVDAFQEITKVDVAGTSKGRGFSGCIRRHGFSRGPTSHGSKNVREPGSTGGKGSVPAKVIKGKRMPGQHGNVRRTVRNLQIVKIDTENDILLVKGPVPGPPGGLVLVSDSITQK